MIANAVALTAVGGSYLVWVSDRLPVSIPDTDALVTISVGVIVALGIGLTFPLLIDMIATEPIESIFGEVGADDPWFYLALGALSVVVIAPAEELLFRGAIQGRIRARQSAVVAILGASVLFMLIHVPNYLTSLPVAVLGASGVGLVSIVFGVVYERTDNLIAPIVVHGFYNLGLGVIAYLSATGSI